MARNDHDRVVALSGLFLAVSQVQQIARHGQCHGEHLETALLSILRVNAASSVAIYGELERLHEGLRLTIQQLDRHHNVELNRYAIALMVLEPKLARRNTLVERLRQGIEEASAKLEYFPVTHESVVASLATTYLETISTLRPRVMVHGEHLHLHQSENAARIRCLLLAGIRAAWLWRQSGGGRLSLLLRRRALVAEAQALLQSTQ